MAKKKTNPELAVFRPASELNLADPQPGLYLDVPLVDYLLIDAFSSSAAKQILISPSHLAEYKRKGPDTEALRLGSLFDCMLFDPDVVERDFVQAPEFFENDAGEQKLWKKRSGSKAAKRYGEELTDNGRKLMVAREAYDDAGEMIAAISGFKPIAKVLAEGTPQVTMIWIDSKTGVLCRARVDWWRPDSMADLKSILAGGAQQLRWPREVKKNGYQVQAGAYVSGRAHLCGGEIVPFKFLVCEKKAPYPRMCYRTGSATMKKGEEDWNRALGIYAECTEQNCWTRGYSESEEVFELLSFDLVEHLTANDDLGEGEEGIGF